MGCCAAGASRRRAALSKLAAAVAIFASGYQFDCSVSRVHENKDEPGAIVATIVLEPWGLVPGAEVHLQDSARGVSLAGEANSCGVVVFDPLPDGIYSLHAAASGMEGVAEKVQVTRGKDSLVQITVKRRGSDAGAMSSRVASCSPPSYASGPHPMYTSEALVQNVQGCLVVKCVIAAAGVVRDCQALEPVRGLTEPSIAALEQRHYTPMICDGKPLDTDYTYRINFRLPR
jgi:hypothetical protein